MNADWTGALRRAEAHAPFLSRAIDRLPDLVALLAASRSRRKATPTSSTPWPAARA